MVIVRLFLCYLALAAQATLSRAEKGTCRAFTNGRTLGEMGAPVALLGYIQRASLDCTPTHTLTVVCGALRRLAVNEDICSKIAEAGGVETCLMVRIHHCQGCFVKSLFGGGWLWCTSPFPP